MDTFDKTVLGVMAGLIAATALVLVLGDHVGVSPSSVLPRPGSTPAASTTIQITFPEAMDMTSVEDRFSTMPEITGSMAWSGRTLLFTPDTALTPGQSVTVKLEPGARTQTGRLMERRTSWSFTPRQPGVMYLAPADAQVRSLWYQSLDGDEPTEVFAPDYGIVDFEPSRNGSQIALTVNNEDMSTDVWVIDSQGGNLRQLTVCAPGLCSAPAWSPDSKLIAYERRDPSPNGRLGPARVWLYDLSSNQTSPVFEDTQVLGFGATWSPDGSRLAFFDANQQAIRVIDLANGQIDFIPSQMGEVGSFAPDGSTMAFVDIRAVGSQFFSEIWLARFGADGGLSIFVELAEEDRAPAWSPTGEWIAFARRRLDRQGGFGSQLMLMNVATGEIKQITDDPNFNNTRFDWDPSGSQLLVQRFNLSATYATIETWLYDLGTNELTLFIDNGFNAQWIP